jgi:hypothetical protein
MLPDLFDVEVFLEGVTSVCRADVRHSIETELENLSITTLMLQGCYNYASVVLQWCYSGVTVVLQRRYSGVTVVL